MKNLTSHLVFLNQNLLFEGDLAATAQAVHALTPEQRQSAVIFETASGMELDLDLRGTARDVAARYPADSPQSTGSGPELEQEATQPPVRKRGRPKLGVVGREITLLPRHWHWLDSQRGGASAALRRLVDEARKVRAGDDAARAAQDRTQRLLTSLAGNLAGFEDAIRALYARDGSAFAEHTGGWPADVRRIASRWAAAALADSGSDADMVPGTELPDNSAGNTGAAGE